MSPTEPWPLPTDIARVAPCVPGAKPKEAVDADAWRDELAVRLGSVGMRFVAEAIDVLSRVEDAKLLAGGQSLMPMMNFRYVTPANVVDLNRVHELAGIAADGDALAIGAMTRQSDIKDSGLVAACVPPARRGIAPCRTRADPSPRHDRRQPRAPRPRRGAAGEPMDFRFRASVFGQDAAWRGCNGNSSTMLADHTPPESYFVTVVPARPFRRHVPRLEIRLDTLPPAPCRVAVPLPASRTPP